MDEKVSSTTPTGARNVRNMKSEQTYATGNSGTTHHRNHETGPSGSVGSTTNEDKDSPKDYGSETRNQTSGPTVEGVRARNSRHSPDCDIFGDSSTSDSGDETGGPAHTIRSRQKHVSGIKPVNAPFFGSLNEN